MPLTVSPDDAVLTKSTEDTDRSRRALSALEDALARNFVLSPIFPVRFNDGTLGRIAAFEVGRSADGRIPIEIVHPDTACAIAGTEFLIYLIQTTRAPQDVADWKRMRTNPPSPQDLYERFEPLAVHFNLFGDVPAFQDRSLETGDTGVEPLLFGTAADNTIKHNKDLFNPVCAAVGTDTAMLALMAGQMYSTAAGAGYRTSMTGGGPLRVLVKGRTLWETVVDNLLYAKDWRPLGNGDTSADARFPWRNYPQKKLTSKDAPADHIYLGCPRRVRLLPPTRIGVCDVTGEAGPVIEVMRKAPGGTDYPSESWRHPNSPYYRHKKGQNVQRLPYLGSRIAGGFAWRDEIGVFHDQGEVNGDGVEPSLPVRVWRLERADALGVDMVRLEAFGLRANNASVEGMVKAVTPFHVVPQDLESDYVSVVNACVVGAEKIVSLLLWQAKVSVSDPEAAKKMPKNYGADMESQFWIASEPAFNAFRADLIPLLENGTPGDAIVLDRIAAFHGALCGIAMSVFDDRRRHDLATEPERIVESRRTLAMSVWSGKVRALFGLPTEKKDGKKAGKKSPAKTSSNAKKT